MTEPLVPLPAVEQLSSRVIRILGGNPGKVSYIRHPRLLSPFDTLLVHTARYVILDWLCEIP